MKIMSEVMKMKRMGILLLSAACIFTLVSCSRTGSYGSVSCGGDKAVKHYNDTEWLNKEPYSSDPDTKEFDVQYIRAGIKAEDYIYPAARVFRSEEELKNYLENETYQSEELLNACEKYDAEYFENRLLIAVLLEEGSGSIRHEVESVSVDYGNLVIEINTIVPEVGTCDMAWWHIFVEPEAGVDVESEEDISVFLDGSLICKDGWQYDIVDEPNSGTFPINIHPVGQSQNKLRIAYCSSLVSAVRDLCRE